MTTEKLYPERDHPALGALYTQHVEAMTAEGLHAKSAIAGQLAWRDAEIARLQAQVDALAGALRAMMDGSVYRSIGGEEPDWHSICMPRRAALEKARAALAAAGR